MPDGTDLYNLVQKHESGRNRLPETIKLFQYLYDTKLYINMPAHYTKVVEALLENGRVK